MMNKTLTTMKKVFALVAVATLFFSCQKEKEFTDSTPTSKFSFKASIEELGSTTKADINSSNELIWAAGDKIGIGVTGWNDSQPFSLEGNGGSSSGNFTWDYGNFDNTGAYAAFFPWQAQGGTYNSAWEGVVYFKMQGSYGNSADLDNTPYSSGKMLTPLVAAVTRTGDAYDPIEFKHAAAAVKVTINNLPAGAHSIGMTADQQLFGNYKINVADAGTEAMALDGTADATCNTIWLNYEPASSERPFTFLFPVPALTTPKLSFVIYDENGVVVWEKKLKAQSSNLGRGDVLEMPAIDITPYEKFKTVSTEWTVIGNVNGTSWNADLAMMTDGSTCIAKGVSFQAGGEFKIRKGGLWDEAYPGSNYVVAEAGTYDIIFDITSHDIKVVASKCPYPAAPITMGVDGNMSEWAAIPGTVRTPDSSNAIEQVKAYADEDYVYVYVKRAKVGRYDKLWGTDSYYYYGFDLDNDPATGANEKNGSNWEAWSFLYIFGATEGEFNTAPTGDTAGMSISNVRCNGAVSTDCIEVEAAFPRDNIPGLPAGTVGVTVWGSKDAGPASTTFTVKPININISIDGDMSDWAKVPGSTTTGIIKSFKMWNDDTNFYFYNSCEPGSRGAELWNGGGYYYYDFDLDNDATTGSYMENGHGPFEAMICIFPFAGTSAAPAIDIVKFFNDNEIATTGIDLKGAIATDLIEVEFVIPRANFTTQVKSGDVISIYNWRAKDGNSTTLTYTIQ